GLRGNRRYLTGTRFDLIPEVRSFLMVKRSSAGLFPRRVAGSIVFAASLVGIIPGALGLDMEETEQAFNEVCSACHSVQSVFEGPRLTAQQWDSTVRDMVGRGAEGTDDQL